MTKTIEVTELTDKIRNEIIKLQGQTPNLGPHGYSNLQGRITSLRWVLQELEKNKV